LSDHRHCSRGFEEQSIDCDRTSTRVHHTPTETTLTTLFDASHLFV
jgi:hypothetical protein